MPKCEITVNIDGIVNPGPFNSEKELDGWLYDHQDSLFEFIDPKTGLVTFSLNPKEGTKQKLAEDIKRWGVLGQKSIPQTNNPDSIEEASLGVTLAMNFAGNKTYMDRPVSNYDPAEQRKRFLTNKEADYIKQGETPDHAKNLAIQDWEQQQKESKLINQIGIGAHAIVENVVTDQSISFKDSRFKVLSGNNKAVQQVLDNVAFPIKRMIKDRFKNISLNSDVLTEIDVYSKELSSEYKSIIQGLKTAQSKIDQLVNSKDKADIKAGLNFQNILAGGKFNLHGKIDMIIVDNDGNLNLYDFKFSREGYDNWSDKKIDAAEMQLQLYAAMLRQAGYKIGQIGIIPVKVTQDLNDLGNNKYELLGNTFNTIVKPCDDFATKTMAELIIPNHEKIDLSSWNESNKKIGQLFEGKGLDKTSQKSDMDVAYFRSVYCNEVVSTDENYEPGKLKWYFYDNVARIESGEKAPKKYFTKENAEEVIGEYLKRFNENRALYNVRIGRKLKEISKLSGTKKTSLMNFLRTFTRDTKVIEGNFNIFYPLLTNGWTLIGETEKDEAAWANGAYFFEKNNVVQVVYLDSSRNLGRKVPINGQSSIFGNTKLDSEIDKTQDLESSYANLLAMKMMCYIADSDYFTGKRVLGITIKNFEETPVFEINNNQLVKNWNKLVFENRKNIEGLRTIDERKMLDDVSAAIFKANLYISSINGGNHLADQVKGIGEYKNDIAKVIANIEFILNKLKSTYFKTTPLTSITGEQLNSPAFKAIMALNKALLSLQNVYLVNELDVGRTWEPQNKSLGTNFSPLFMSESSNLRNLDKISTAYFDDLANRFRKEALPWQKLMKDAIEEWKQHPELGYHSEIGDEFKIFNLWFRRDALDESKINRNLILRDPNDAYFDNLPASRKLLSYFLDKINIMRYGNEEKSLFAKADNPEAWYSVPLMRSGMREQASKLKNWDDLKHAFEAWWKRKTETGLEGYDDAEMEKEIIDQMNDLDSDKLKNIYFQLTESKRQELIDKQSNVYETNLDIIFLRALAEDSKVKSSEIFLPMFTAYRTLLYYNSVINHQPAEQIMQTANDFIRRRVFRQNIIDIKLQGISMITGMLRQLVSSITLGVNMRNFVRENLISFIDSAKETFLKVGYNVFPVPANDIASRRKYFSYYKDSLAKVASSTLSMNDVMSEVQQLNAMYRMVDYDQRKMAHTARTNRFAPMNLTEDFLYITSNLPDFYHRNAILIASLKYLGAWDAHQINEETGELEYDMAKDSRYKILFDYNFDRSKVPYDKFNEYIKAENAYNIALNDWNSIGAKYKFGDKFELALSPREAANIRNFGHVMFGCYDPSQRAMINEYFLGSLFFQFKTYALNQVIKYTRSGGAINIIHANYIVDEDTGEQLYDVATTTPEDFKKYGASKRVKFSEVSREDLISGKAKPAVNYTGAYMDGMIKTVIQIPGIIMKWDQEELNKYWNQPHVRANILGSLWDNLFMLIMALLVRQMYGADVITDMDEQTWLTQWTYAVLTGITKNGVIWEVANSIYGDGTPPMISSLKRYYSTVQNIIFGDTNFLYAFTNTIGATKELSAIFKPEE